jgi:hypothetical protein
MVYIMDNTPILGLTTIYKKKTYPGIFLYLGYNEVICMGSIGGWDYENLIIGIIKWEKKVVKE